MLSVTNKKLENISYKLILVATALVVGGISISSIFNPLIYIAVSGSFFLFVGLLIFVFSQFSEEKVEHKVEHHKIKQ